MLDSIYIGQSGLEGYQEGLKVISNNTANINTPGFKSSTLQFSDLFYSAQEDGNVGGEQIGNGLNTGKSIFNFADGSFNQTGNDLDMAVDGQGFFILQDSEGNLTYTRDGQFHFDNKGVLINTADSSKVMGLDANGNLVPITLDNLAVSGGNATTTVKFTGNLSSSGTTQSVGSITVIDAAGGSHQLTANFTSTATPGTWTVTLMDGTTSVGSGTIAFINGEPDPANDTVAITYTPAGGAATPLTLDFSTNVTSFASAGLTTLSMASQDGIAPGDMTKSVFDANGILQITYSNGNTVAGPQLALANYTTTDNVEAAGDNRFKAVDGQRWQIGTAGNGTFGGIKTGGIEMSNVDLSQEFSNLVITQRGYQAASQIVSTANDMLQELFSMKDK